VAAPRRHAARPRWLTRDAIVEAALLLADREGFEAVSMRSVARALGVGTMSLYHHVADKDELIYLMADAIAAEMVIPGEVPSDWREALRQIAHRTRDTFMRHPWLLEPGTRRPIGTPNMLRHIEQSAQAVAGLDIEEHVAMTMVLAVDDYTIGCTARTINARRWTAPPLPERTRELLDSGAFPHVSRFFGEGRGFPPPPPDRFEDGLEWLLDGMAAALARERR
jgi:AcrR family transcriptional regulator